MWVARDEDGELGLFRERPIKGVHEWYLYANYNRFDLYPSLFPKLTWYDEPLEVELVVKGRVEELIEYICKQNSEIRELKNENKGTV